MQASSGAVVALCFQSEQSGLTGESPSVSQSTGDVLAWISSLNASSSRTGIDAGVSVDKEIYCNSGAVSDTQKGLLSLPACVCLFVAVSVCLCVSTWFPFFRFRSIEDFLALIVALRCLTLRLARLSRRRTMR